MEGRDGRDLGGHEGEERSGWCLCSRSRCLLIQPEISSRFKLAQSFFPAQTAPVFWPAPVARVQLTLSSASRASRSTWTLRSSACWRFLLSSSASAPSLAATDLQARNLIKLAFLFAPGCLVKNKGMTSLTKALLSVSCFIHTRSKLNLLHEIIY